METRGNDGLVWATDLKFSHTPLDYVPPEKVPVLEKSAADIRSVIGLNCTTLLFLPTLPSTELSYQNHPELT